MTAIRASASALLGTTTGTITTPSSTAVGDVIYVIIAHGVTSETFTPPTGYTLMSGPTSTQAMTTAVYSKIADATDANKVVTFGASGAAGKWALNMIVVSGASAAGTIAFSASTAASTNRTAPALMCADRSIEVGITKGTSPLAWASYPATFVAVNTVMQSGSGAVLIDVATSTSDLDGNDVWVGGASQNQSVMYTLSPTPVVAATTAPSIGLLALL